MQTKKQFLDDLFSQMTVLVDRNQYNRTIYFAISNKVYMDYNVANNQMWCNYDGIWSILKMRYFCNEEEVKKLIMDRVKLRFKMYNTEPKATPKGEKMYYLRTNLLN